MGLVVDTGVLIRAERDGVSASSLLATLTRKTGESDLIVSVVTLAELAHAQRRTQNPELIVHRETFLDAVQDAFPIHIVNAPIAIRSGLLDGALKASGYQVGFADLLIAATALDYDYGVLTLNLRDYQRIPSLYVMDAGRL